MKFTLSWLRDYLETDHTEIELSWQDIHSIIPDLQDIYSEPFADSSQLATFLICKQIRSNGIKVAFGGDGADEFFGGYNRHSYIPDIYKNKSSYGCQNDVTKYFIPFVNVAINFVKFKPVPLCQTNEDDTVSEHYHQTCVV